MDRLNKDNKLTAQGVSERPVGNTSGFPGSTRRSSSYWKNDGGEVVSQAPPRTVKATGEKVGSRKLAFGGEKPRKVADIKLSDNVTISVILRAKGEEEGDPFRPSKKIQRSPTTGGRADVEVVEESEGSYRIRDSDHSTPVVVRGGAPAKQLENWWRTKSEEAEEEKSAC